MKPNMILKILQVLVIILLIFIIGCEYDAPVNPWNDIKNKSETAPVITEVLPEDAGAASEIIIVGENFSPIKENNSVHFGSEPALIKSATSTEIVVFRPNVVGDSLIITIYVKDIAPIAEYSYYKLESVVSPFGILLEEEGIAAFAIDENENIFTAMIDDDESLLKFTPTGARDTSFHAFASKFTNDIKIGADGYFYYARKRNQIIRIDPVTWEDETFVRFRGDDDYILPKFLDFDKNQNIYAGGEETGLVVINPDETYTKYTSYDSEDIQSIRIFYDESDVGYVYVAAIFVGDTSETPEASQGIWKHEILDSDGSLGDRQLVINWDNTGEYSESEILDITFSESGDLYVATDYEEPICVARSSESYSTIYPFFLGLIDTPVDKFFWGNSNYLYALINRRIPIGEEENPGQFVKITMEENGAPYYGRDE